ncbi:MAG: hypothetical protein JNN20_06265, partial [Betaproteobacteria bacterium]|nr:hypothetical protein [Betaproteobacteria bacterium]
MSIFDSSGHFDRLIKQAREAERLYAPIREAVEQHNALKAALGPMTTLANAVDALHRNSAFTQQLDFMDSMRDQLRALKPQIGTFSITQQLLLKHEREAAQLNELIHAAQTPSAAMRTLMSSGFAREYSAFAQLTRDAIDNFQVRGPSIGTALMRDALDTSVLLKGI